MNECFYQVLYLNQIWNIYEYLPCSAQVEWKITIRRNLSGGDLEWEIQGQCDMKLGSYKH